jgi:hypothetical protein
MTRTLKRLPKLATLASMIIIAACADGGPTLAPVADDSQLAPPAMPSVIAPQAIVAEVVTAPVSTGHATFATVYPSNAVTYQVTYNPTTNASFIFGWHMVSFPKYTICDPDSSGYGSSQWLNNCSKLTSSITITATTWTDANGRPQIDFANSIRFYRNNYNQLPAIYLRDPAAALSDWSRIDYCSGSGVCVNELANDSALATQRDPVTGYLFRLIRHFSGYNVWA